LGCGTGRVAVQLIPLCGYYQGIDISPSMLAVCRKKLDDAGLLSEHARIDEGDITHFDLSRTFDFIIAPYRVLQNLETDAQVDGLFQCIHRHLAPGGTCILNAFMPNRDPDGLRQHWCSDEEHLNYEVRAGDERLVCYDRRPRMNAERLILYPESIYRRFEGDTLKEEAVLKFVMRCYYPDAFAQLIREHGFTILNRWGGYAGEAYGEGPELVIQFR
jgi:SAM-dependent methyltransferase